MTDLAILWMLFFGAASAFLLGLAVSAIYIAAPRVRAIGSFIVRRIR
jgi:hypothetical protein